jgi:polysaccharide chain length determinant protein (PEP-CTERM system associated)
MDEVLRQAIEYVRGMWQRRWIGLATAWLVALAGAAVIWRMPPVYEASARVFVDTASVLRPLMAGLAVQLDTDQQIAMLGKTLISRPNIERLMQMADLDLAVKTPADRERMVEDLAAGLRIQSATRDGRDNLYLLSYRERSPDEAKRVVQAMLSIFVESSLGDKKKDTDTARRFIDDQIKQYEKRLEEAENRVKEFKLRNIGLTASTEGRNYFTRMSSLGEDIAKARLEYRAAEQGRDALKRELSGETAVLLPDVSPSDSSSSSAASAGVSSEVDARIDSLKKQLDELQRKYTDQHPDVAGTKRVIAELEKQRNDEIQAKRKAVVEASKTEPGRARVAAADRNPVFQQLRVSLAEAEANVASLRSRLNEYESRYTELRVSAQKLPQVEAELAQLNRDYEIQRKNYEALVSRRESAALSGDMEATGVAEFKVIDPPRVSPTPVAPNRMLLLAGALGASLAAGLFASFVAGQAAPTFHDTRTLGEAMKRPVLGSVSMIAKPEYLRKRRRGFWLFLSALCGLLILYGAALLFMLVSAKPI